MPNVGPGPHCSPDWHSQDCVHAWTLMPPPMHVVMPGVVHDALWANMLMQQTLFGAQFAVLRQAMSGSWLVGMQLPAARQA